MNTAGTAIPAKQFLVFREIGNEQISAGTYKNYTYSSIDFSKVTDEDTFNTNNTLDGSSLRTTFTTKLVKDRQYRAQIYIFIENTQNVTNLVLDAVNANTWLSITAVEGKTQLEPQRFLPDMQQVDFIQAVFKMFNLFYDIDNTNKIINLYTRDEWFDQNKSNVLDISSNLDLDEFVYKPLPEKDIAETYYKWANDESDYILNTTSYLEKVNGNVPADAPELPFAPLSFLRVQYSYQPDYSTPKVYGYELVPSAIPYTDTVDSTLLDDYEASSNFSYKPKLAIYHGSGYLKSNANVIEPYGYYFSIGLLTPNKNLPKLTFFNMREQPSYEIEVIPATREFKVNEAPNVTIYTANDLNFITSAAKTDELDTTSIALTGNKSLFQNLYRNDLIITNYSNYFEGFIKMNPVLYSRLNGRNLLLIDGDLYLLESIQQYELGGDFAKIKIYQMLTS